MLVAGGEVRWICERCGEGSNPPQDGGRMRWCWKTTTNLENEHERSFLTVVVLAVSKRRKKKNGRRSRGRLGVGLPSRILKERGVVWSGKALHHSKMRGGLGVGNGSPPSCVLSE